MDEEDVDYRELLQHQTPEQRNIQRLEWRWARRLPKWEKATLRIQAWYRGELGRREAKRAQEIRAPLLKSRRLCATAEVAIQEGRLNDAVNHLTESIEEHDATYWLAYSLRGRLRYQERNAPGALRDLSVCVREQPQDRVALKARARVYVSVRRWEDASRDLSVALRMNPHDLEAYLLRGNALIHMDNYNGAVYDFGMVIDRADIPTHGDYIRRACAYCCQQNWQKALEDLGCSIAIQENSEALVLRGRVYACMRRWKPAVADYDAALEKNPDNAVASDARAEALIPYTPLPMIGTEEAARILAGE